MFVLRKHVAVAEDGAPGSSPLKIYPAGTPLTDIADSELAQLAADHFCDDETQERAEGDIHPEVGRLAAEAAAAGEDA